MHTRSPFRFPYAVVMAALLGIGGDALAADSYPAANAMCPAFGWQEGLSQYLKPNAPFPVNDTKNVPTPDCNFHQWSAEAFVWASALNKNGVPRFMELPTPDMLLESGTSNAKPHMLRLGARSLIPHGAAGFTEGAGAIVEADGNIMIAPNGYPVYASVHMNQSYFNTAKKNLLKNNGYLTQPTDSYFDLGAAVFKATWLRLAAGEAAPKGAFTTEAEVPVLTVWRTKNTYTVVPSGAYTKATVALVGLHVVGFTWNHPEFLWGTFEHEHNTPATLDNTFPGPGTDSNSFTFYKANTPYTQVNQPNPPQQGQSYVPPQLEFNLLTQKFSPSTNAVLENKTGGENNSPDGPANIQAVTKQLQAFYVGLKSPQSAFGSYVLDGTVWMKPNFYEGTSPTVLNANAANGVGSVNLANTTAETFEQYPSNSDMQKVQNCFMCHNANTLQGVPILPNAPKNLGPTYPLRRIAISHVLEVGTVDAVPNMITVPINNTASKP